MPILRGHRFEGARITRYPLERAVEAYDDLRAGTIEGRAVVVP